MNRPMTQAELIEARKSRRPEEFITLTNKSRTQIVPIQLRAPAGVPFVIGEQTVQLFPQQSAKFPKSRLMSEQVINLTKLGLLRVLS